MILTDISIATVTDITGVAEEGEIHEGKWGWV